MSKKPLKVLVSAYACEPDKGSEPGVGWNWVSAIAAHHDVWVCTKGNNRKTIEKELELNPNDRLHFIYVELPKWLTFWKKGQRGVHAYYYLWQFAALYHAIKTHKRINFDLGHHVTFVNAWIWTFLALMPIPFVWGPIGTNNRFPPQLLPRTIDKVKNLLRYSLQVLIRSADPLYWVSAARAKMILVINKDTANIFPLKLIAEHKIRIEPAIGMEVFNTVRKMDDNFNVLFVGRFILIKGLHLAIDAFSLFSQEKSNVRFTIIGEGVLENKLRESVQLKRIEDKVVFLPWLPREQVIHAMQQSDAFLFPSMEGAGMVVLEAMASEVPIICLDYGGPGTMVDEESGFRVPVEGYSKTVSSIQRALDYLYNNESARKEMGRNARQRVLNNYTWNRKSQTADQCYEAVLNS